MLSEQYRGLTGMTADGSDGPWGLRATGGVAAGHTGRRNVGPLDSPVGCQGSTVSRHRARANTTRAGATPNTPRHTHTHTHTHTHRVQRCRPVPPLPGQFVPPIHTYTEKPAIGDHHRTPGPREVPSHHCVGANRPVEGSHTVQSPEGAAKRSSPGLLPLKRPSWNVHYARVSSVARPTHQAHQPRTEREFTIPAAAGIPESSAAWRSDRAAIYTTQRPAGQRRPAG